MGRRDGICLHCARRRSIETIHRTAGGFVARFDYAPCDCPPSQRIAGRRRTNRNLYGFALLPGAITVICGLAFPSWWLLAAGAVTMIAGAVGLWLNREMKR